MKAVTLIFLLLLLSLTSAVPLFDINLDIPESYATLQAGNDLLVSIKLVNLGSAGRIDVFLNYLIKDEQGKILLTKLETVAVETQANFVRSFYIPPHTKPGRYTIETQLIYSSGHQAASAATFNIIESPTLPPVRENNVYQDIFYILASLLLLDLLALVTIKYLGPLIKRNSVSPKSFYTSKLRRKQK